MTSRPDSPAADESFLTAGDLGRRVLLRRRELGLQRSELARRAGISVPYLRYVESSTSHPTRHTLRALARVLETSEDELLGGDRIRPPGQGPSSSRSHLTHLSEPECYQLLSDHGVARIGFVVDDDVLILPVNYAVAEDLVWVRTSSTTALAHHVNDSARVSVEVDRLDEATSGGWSVLLTGQARRLRPPESGRALPVPVQSWIRGDRSLVITVLPDSVTGRRLLG